MHTLVVGCITLATHLSFFMSISGGWWDFIYLKLVINQLCVCVQFGDLDLSSAEVYQQEERLRQLRNSYEEQCRVRTSAYFSYFLSFNQYLIFCFVCKSFVMCAVQELQDRIDELQAQLEEFHALSCAPQTSLMPSLSDELDSTSPGMESDQGGDYFLSHAYSWVTNFEKKLGTFYALIAVILFPFF